MERSRVSYTKLSDGSIEIGVNLYINIYLQHHLITTFQIVIVINVNVFMHVNGVLMLYRIKEWIRNTWCKYVHREGSYCPKCNTYTDSAWDFYVVPN